MHHCSSRECQRGGPSSTVVNEYGTGVKGRAGGQRLARIHISWAEYTITEGKEIAGEKILKGQAHESGRPWSENPYASGFQLIRELGHKLEVEIIRWLLKCTELAIIAVIEIGTVPTITVSINGTLKISTTSLVTNKEGENSTKKRKRAANIKFYDSSNFALMAPIAPQGLVPVWPIPTTAFTGRTTFYMLPPGTNSTVADIYSILTTLHIYNLKHSSFQL